MWHRAWTAMPPGHADPRAPLLPSCALGGVVVVLPRREDKPHGTLGLWVSGHCPPAPCLASSPHTPSIAGPHSLVLNLEIEVPAEPVNEERRFHIAGGCQLQGQERCKGETLA